MDRHGQSLQELLPSQTLSGGVRDFQDCLCSSSNVGKAILPDSLHLFPELDYSGFTLVFEGNYNKGTGFLSCCSVSRGLNYEHSELCAKTLVSCPVREEATSPGARF